MSSEVFLRVRGVIVKLLEHDGITDADIELDTKLVDLGLDSLTIVDVVVAIEKELGLEQFPLQQWADIEAAREQDGFRLSSIVETCLCLLQTKPGAH